MPKIVTISDSDADLEALGEEIEEEFNKVERGGRGGGRSKGEKGKKTFKAIARISVENATKKRRETSENFVKKTLIHFPLSDNKEVNHQKVGEYADWLIESLKMKEPFIKISDLEYSQFKSGGPGGQNVNKVANAVLYRHKPTGLFANSKDSRNTIENRNHAAEVLYENLQDLVSNWTLVLNGIEEKDWKEAITTFVEKFQEK